MNTLPASRPIPTACILGFDVQVTWGGALEFDVRKYCVPFKPSKLTSNIPVPGVVYLTHFEIGNISLISDGSVDIHTFNRLAESECKLNMPIGNNVRLAGRYSGFCLERPHTYGSVFQIALTLIGEL
jgi:hypothetical protein